MNISCDVVMDLMPLIKDNVASEDSIKLVSEHLKSCETCKFEFESYGSPIATKIDDKRVIASITKKLFIVSSMLLFIGAFIGMVLNKNTTLNIIPATIGVLVIVFIGILILKFDLKGDRSVRKFFVGKAIGTIIVFSILGIYLLIKYLLQLF